jgi:hypothetical protein
MMRAINYNESICLRKGLFSLQIHTKKQHKYRQISRVIQEKVNMNMKIFYFKTYMKMYMREQKRKYMRGVAKSYFFEQRKFKTFKGWQKVVLTRK